MPFFFYPLLIFCGRARANYLCANSALAWWRRRRSDGRMVARSRGESMNIGRSGTLSLRFLLLISA